MGQLSTRQRIPSVSHLCPTGISNNMPSRKSFVVNKTSKFAVFDVQGGEKNKLEKVKKKSKTYDSYIRSSGTRLFLSRLMPSKCTAMLRAQQQPDETKMQVACDRCMHFCCLPQGLCLLPWAHAWPVRVQCTLWCLNRESGIFVGRARTHHINPSHHFWISVFLVIFQD